MAKYNWFRIFTMAGAVAAAAATASTRDFVTAGGILLAAFTSPSLKKAD